MRVAVTGAAGFIGSHLCEALARCGHLVIGIDALTPYYAPLAKQTNLAEIGESVDRMYEVDLRTADLRSLLDGVDAVFHQAAQPGVRTSWGEGFADYASHNVVGTQRLLEASAEAGAHRFVYASSSSIYGLAARDQVSEDVLPQPYSPYGVTKLAGEHLCSSYASNFGLHTVSLRYFTVYGPRQRPDMGIHRLIEAALTGAPFPMYGTGEQRREFTFVSDIVSANLAALDADLEPGTVFNIAGGSEIALSELVHLVEEITDRRLTVDRREASPGDVARNRADVRRAASALEWAPEVDLIEGVERQVDWHRSRLDSAIRRPQLGS